MSQSTRPKQLAVRPSLQVAISLAALVLLGTLLFLLPWVSTRGLTAGEAAFTAVSALTVTGLSVITASTDLTLLGQALLLVLIQVGGIGYMVFAVTAFRLIGRKIGLAERLALQDSLGLLNPGGLVELVRHVLVTVLSIEALGMLALWLHWRSFMTEGTALWYAAFHSVSAFCNAGFDLFSGHPEHLEGIPRDNTTLAILSVLIFLGGLGIPVLFDFARWRRHAPTLHTRITVPVVLTLVVVGSIAFYISEAWLPGILNGLPFDRSAMMSTFQTVSSRTAGMTGVPDFTEIRPATLVMLSTLMFIGSAPASMGGGITTGTFTVMILSLVAYARGQNRVVFKGRSIPNEMVRRSAAVLAVAILLVVFSIWLIALTHDQSLRMIGFEVVSAYSTSGLSMGMTSELNWFGRVVIMVVMFWGRLGALTILVGFARNRAPSHVRYPEEKILIG